MKTMKGTLSNSFLQGLSAYEIAVKNGFVGSEEDWLEHLANSVKRELTGVRTSASKYYAEVTPISGTSWSLTAHIISIDPAYPNSEQSCDLYIACINGELTSYYTNNSILDIAQRGINNNILCYSTEGKWYLGFDMLDTNENYNRNISVVLYDINNCLATFSNTEDTTIIGGSTVYINFKDNGFFYLDKEKPLSYSELIDKPELLDLSIDEDTENLVFYKEVK